MNTESAGSATGLEMPAEWQRHDATWLTWPKDPLTFPPGIIERVEEIYVKMVLALSSGETVRILVDDAKTKRRVAALFTGARNVSFQLIKTADVWIRDYGPIFVKDRDGQVVATKWRFNAWGDKYDELKADDASGLQVAVASGLQIVEQDFVLEGGSIDTNGLGSCITTEQCLLNKNRNPSFQRKEIEEILKENLGFSNLIWLGRGIAGDDTDGHVDDLARFVREDTVICMVEDDKRDENYLPLLDNLELLKKARDQRGRRLRVIPISMPRKRVGGEERLPASYANFYIGNSVVLVPTFDDVNDRAALATIAEAFPEKEVIGVNCEALVYGFGGIHCVTQQQPSPSAAPKKRKAASP